jgi:predicted nucleic acid-binding protein
MAIASCLVDTNILLRITSRSDPQHSIVDAALARLAGEGTDMYYTLQNIAELWNVMTRPLTRNGFGLAVAEAEREVRAIESGMKLLADNMKRFTVNGEILFCALEYQEFRCTMLDWLQPCMCMALTIY